MSGATCSCGREYPISCASTRCRRHDNLAGRTSATRRDALAAIDALHALGPKAIMVTSLHTDDTPVESIDLIASDASGRCRVRTPRLAISANGAGDAIAALFFAHYLRTASTAEALSRAASSTS